MSGMATMDRAFRSNEIGRNSRVIGKRTAVALGANDKAHLDHPELGAGAPVLTPWARMPRSMIASATARTSVKRRLSKKKARANVGNVAPAEMDIGDGDGLSALRFGSCR